MDLGEINIYKSIVHVLDSDHNDLILSNKSIQFNSDFQDFLKNHILNILNGDDAKNCEFREDSEIEKILRYENDFVVKSQLLSKKLFSLMQYYRKIPAADLVILEFTYKNSCWLALLKVNFIVTYTHEVTKQCTKIVEISNAFPKSSTKLKEAAIINLDTYELRVREKKFEVDGIKANYFSGYFLRCTSGLSEEEKIKVIKNSFNYVLNKIEKTNKAIHSIRLKNEMKRQFSINGSINTEELAKKIFIGNDRAKGEFLEKLSKYHLRESIITPKKINTIEKINRHKIVTNGGVELLIPFNSNVEEIIDFKSEDDGTTSIIIRNYG